MVHRNITKDFILNELRRVKPELEKKYGVSEIGLFGSYVTGTEDGDSDIDIVIGLKHPDLFALIHIKELLEDDFCKPVDVVPFSSQMSSQLKTRIEKEAVYV